jgi:hypothetical protein
MATRVASDSRSPLASASVNLDSESAWSCLIPEINAQQEPGCGYVPVSQDLATDMRLVPVTQIIMIARSDTVASTRRAT